jgi:hypothetical protein
MIRDALALFFMFTGFYAAWCATPAYAADASLEQFTACAFFAAIGFGLASGFALLIHRAFAAQSRRERRSKLEAF